MRILRPVAFRMSKIALLAMLLGTAPADGRAQLAMGPTAANPLWPEPGLRIDLHATETKPTSVSQVPNHRAYVGPVLLSALVPGAGEISIGHWKRGVPLVALDAMTWILYAHFRTEGYDMRTEYEAYADAHWVYSRADDRNANGDRDPGEQWGWQESLQRYYDGQGGPNYDYWDPNSPYNCTCPYISKEDDKQHYYENIGKYLYYYPGWDDWEYSGDPATSDSRAHRATYASMRQESNADFDHSTSMIVVAMLTRLGSMVQSALLVRGDLHSLELQPVKMSSRGAGLRLAWRY